MLLPVRLAYVRLSLVVTALLFACVLYQLQWSTSAASSEPPPLTLDTSNVCDKNDCASHTTTVPCSLASAHCGTYVFAQACANSMAAGSGVSRRGVARMRMVWLGSAAKGVHASTEVRAQSAPSKPAADIC